MRFCSLDCCLLEFCLDSPDMQRMSLMNHTNYANFIEPAGEAASRETRDSLRASPGGGLFFFDYNRF